MFWRKNRACAKMLICVLVLLVFVGTLSGCSNDGKDNNEIIIDGISYYFYDYGGEKYYFVYKATDTSITSVQIKDYINGYPVKRIGGDGGWGVGPFQKCENLTEVIIPDTVTLIGNYAFERCSGLEAILLPDSIEVIGYSAFKHCTSLKSIEIPNSVEKISSSCFESCTSLENIKMPKNLKTISYDAFSECTSLKEVDLPDGATTISSKAFLDCSALERINLPDSITNIGPMAFWGCENLYKLRIPRGVTVITQYLTFDCTKMEEVYIPKSVTEIQKSAFGFNHSRTVLRVFYEGSFDDWQAIDVDMEGNQRIADWQMENFTFNSYE